MTDIPATPGNGAAKPAERRVRHGLIEDWRDAFGILLLLLVAALLGAVITRYFFDGDDAAPALAADVGARLTALEARQSPRELSNLKDRVAKLETRLRLAEVAGTAAKVGSDLAATAFGTTPGAPGSALAALETAHKQADDLAARLAALETKLATTPDDVKGLSTNIAGLGAKIDAFAERLAKLENSDLLEMARRASLATAIANLSRAAEGSAPFKREFDVVANLTPSDPRIAEIAPLAQKGVPTASTLMTTFGDLATRALNAEEAAKAGDWLSHLWVNFTSLIASRKVGEIGDNTNEGRLARAELRLKSGDLAAAMRELSLVDGAAREPLKPWLADATSRIRLEAALADLNARAIEALTGPTATGSSEPVPQLPNP